MVTLAILALIVVLVGSLFSLWGRPVEGIGVPIIAIAVFAWIYILQPAYMIWDSQLGFYLTDAMIVRALLVPTAALFCLMWGWRHGERTGRKLLQASPSEQGWSARRLYTLEQGWSARRLYTFGLVAACVGTALHVLWVQRSGGFVRAYGQMHARGFNNEGYTAYIYYGMFWVLSGVAMMIVSASKQRLSPAQQTAIAVLAGSYALNGVLTGSRHDVFAISAVLWVGWSLARGTRPTIDRATPALAIACVGALLMVGYRSVLYFSSDKPEAPSWAEAYARALGEDEVSIRYRIASVEFVVHAAAIETVAQTHHYDFAYNWLPVYAVHWIPKIWWPNKPPLRLAGVPETQLGPGITRGELLDATNVRLSEGCATGMVAEMYMSFGLFSLLFFIWLGWCARRLLLRAEYLRTPLAMCTYTMAMSLSLNAFGQGFGTILAPLPYSLAPVFLYYWADRHYRRRLAMGSLAPRISSQLKFGRCFDADL